MDFTLKYSKLHEEILATDKKIFWSYFQTAAWLNKFNKALTVTETKIN